MGATKVLLDTNILISALGWLGKSSEIFKKVINDKCELITSYPQLVELERVMKYSKFEFPDNQKEIFMLLMLQYATIVDVFGTVQVIKEDPDDNIILETALIGKAEYLISGDPHLLKLGEYQGLKILTAHEFLEKISP